ncbi:12941_t:CDS:2, partial [Racocetra persica]
AINNQISNMTKSTLYKLIFGQQPQADLQMISMLHRQNIFYEEDISLENQSSLINNDNSDNNNNDLESNDDKMNISQDHSLIEEFTNCDTKLQNSWNKKEKWHLENTCNNSDTLLDGTFQDYKLHDNLFQADTNFEGSIQENHESLMSVDNQSHSSHSSFDNHKQLRDKALQQVKKISKLFVVLWKS